MVSLSSNFENQPWHPNTSIVARQPTAIGPQQQTPVQCPNLPSMGPQVQYSALPAFGQSMARDSISEALVSAPMNTVGGTTTAGTPSQQLSIADYGGVFNLDPANTALPDLQPLEDWFDQDIGIAPVTDSTMSHSQTPSIPQVSSADTTETRTPEFANDARDSEWPISLQHLRVVNGVDPRKVYYFVGKFCDIHIRVNFGRELAVRVPDVRLEVLRDEIIPENEYNSQTRWVARIVPNGNGLLKEYSIGGDWLRRTISQHVADDETAELKLAFYDGSKWNTPQFSPMQ